MKLLLEFDGLPKKNDIIYYDGKKWVVISKEKFQEDINLNVIELENKVAEFEAQVIALSEKCNQIDKFKQTLIAYGLEQMEESEDE